MHMQADKLEQAPSIEEPKLRVLMSAYTCTPGLSSEPGIGWHNIVQVARFHEVWAFTSEGNRKSIEAEIAVNPLPNVHWVYIDLPSWLSWYLTGEKGGRIHYYLYQIAAYQQAKKLQDDIEFDVVHHVTYGSYWTPVFLSRLKAPFIWGPVGGGESAPASFYKTLNFRGRLYERIRDTVRWFAHNFDPFVRETAKNASLSLATTNESAEKMRDVGTKNVELLPAICMAEVDLDRLLAIPLTTQTDKISFISIGRFLGWKGYHLSLQAFARFHEDYPNSQYMIVGRGPQLQALKSLVEQLEIADAVIFTGFIPHAEAMDWLAKSDVLVHPSLHDSGGATCLESMTAARPVLCLNLGGPALLVTEETGIIVSAESPEISIQELTNAMHVFAENPDKRKVMGDKGRAHVLENYTWQKRGDYLHKRYMKLLEYV